MADTKGIKVPEKVKLTSHRPDRKDVFAEQLLREGKTVLMGGLSTIGEARCKVSLINIIQVQGDEGKEDFRGWYFCIGHPKIEDGFNRFDIETGALPVEEIPVPDTICIVVEVDPSLVEEDADRQELQEIIDWTIPQISED